MAQDLGLAETNCDNLSHNLGPIFRSHKSQTTNHKLQITKGPKSTNHKNPIFRSICKNAKINCSSFEFVKKVRDLTGKKENFEDGFWGNPWTKMETQGCFGIRRSCRIWFWPSAHLTLTFEIGRPTPARDWLGWKWKRELSQSFLGLFWHFLCLWHSEFWGRSDCDLCAEIGWGRGHSEPWGHPKLTLGFLGRSWPNFQTFCVLGTQNFKAKLIMTFARRLVEVEVTRSREVIPNWPWDFSAVPGPIFCVLGTQNFNANLILTFAYKLVEIEVTRIGEVFPNWPLSFSAISGSFLTFRVPLAPRIMSPIWLWPLRTDWLKSRTFQSAVPFLKLYH